MDVAGIAAVRSDYADLLNEGVPLDELVFTIMMEKADKLDKLIRGQLEDLEKLRRFSSDNYKLLEERLKAVMKANGGKFPIEIPEDLKRDLKDAGIDFDDKKASYSGKEFSETIWVPCMKKKATAPAKPDESTTQMKMLAINSDMNKRNLFFELSSNVLKKCQDSRQSIISNIRG